jgi:purine-nucleoside phosphorylase
MQNIREVIHTISGELSKKINLKPQIGLILGTGLGNLAEKVESPVVIPYADLPGWPISTVEGHAGRLVIGSLEGKNIIVMQGRVHFYEGYSMQQVTLPVRILQNIGIEILIVTNAAGAINPRFSAGDLMLITDNLNIAGMAGFNPLIGQNLDEYGPRFPDMSRVYDRTLSEFARDVAKKNHILLQEGVYAGLSGPSFETPAELRFLHSAGADAVGMSTTAEVIIARHGGLKVLGFSGISNKANLDGDTITTHAEVLAAGKILGPKLEKMVFGVIKEIQLGQDG